MACTGVPLSKSLITIKAAGDARFSNEKVENLLDAGQGPHDKWLHYHAPNGTTRVESSWLEFTLSEPRVMCGYALQSANDCPERDPVAWTLQGRRAAGDPWEDLHSVASASFTARWQVLEYTLPVTQVCCALRLLLSRVRAPGNGVQLGHVRLLGKPQHAELVVSAGAGGQTNPRIASITSYGFTTGAGEEWRGSHAGVTLLYSCQTLPSVSASGSFQGGHMGILLRDNSFSSPLGSYKYGQADNGGSGIRLTLSDAGTYLVKLQHKVADVQTINVPAMVEKLKQLVNLPFQIPHGMTKPSDYIAMIKQMAFTNCTHTAFQLAASIVGEAVALKEIMAFFKVQQEGLATQCAASPAVSARVASSMGPASPPPGASAHQWAEALGSLPTGVGSQVRAPGPDAGRWTSSTPPSGTAAGGRPTVGAIVRLAKDTVNTRGGCLGAKAEGKTGEIVRDDHDHKPFRVRCGLQEHWYHEDEVEAAAAPGGDQRPAVGDTVALSAGALPFLLAIDDNSTSWAARALGLPGCGRPGIVKVDDHCDLRQGATSRPFKVAAMVNGSETMDWYPLGALAVRSRAAPFTPLARLPVGALVRSAASAGDARCLGASGSGLVGRLEVDDGTGRPFCVQLLDGSAYHWYRESEIVADRPTVGATVRLAKDTDSTRGKCLGDMAEGKSGEIMRDDHDSQPFLVRGGVGGEQHWYREDELIELSAPSIPFRRPAVGDTVALSAAAQVIMSASGVRDDYWRDGALGLHGQGKTGVVIRDDECDKSARSGFPLPFAVASSTGGSSTWYPLGALVVRRAPHLLVGSLVRAAVATSRCLGAPGCGRIGKIEADDASNNPYLVRLLDGSDSDWYTHGELEVAPRAPSGRPAVGDTLALTRDTEHTRGGCLGAKAEGKTGLLIRDDRDSNPFKVRCGDKESFYREGEVEAVAPALHSVGEHCVFMRCSGDVTAAEWATCPGATLAFSVGSEFGPIASIKGAFFTPAAYPTLWAPLCVLRAPVISVGDRVRLMRDRPEISGKCLGRVADNRMGKVVVTDQSAQPYKVDFQGSLDWYYTGDLERV